MFRVLTLILLYPNYFPQITRKLKIKIVRCNVHCTYLEMLILTENRKKNPCQSDLRNCYSIEAAQVQTARGHN